jgi:hypothetical protein
MMGIEIITMVVIMIVNTNAVKIVASVNMDNVFFVNLDLI